MSSAARSRPVRTGGHRADGSPVPEPRTTRSRSGVRGADHGRSTDGSTTRSTDGSTTRSADRGTPRAAADSTSPLLPVPRWFPVAVLIGGPVLGVALGTALGGYHGPLFAVLTVASAALATASARPNGRWWVMLSAPPVAWLVAAAAELLLHDPPYRDTKAKAVGLVHATSHAFPVILVAAVAMGVVWTAAVVAAKPSRNRARSRPRTRPRRPAPGLVAGRALASFLGLAVVATTGFVWFENKQLTDGVHTTGSIKEVKQGDDGYVPRTSATTSTCC
ncbi:hypothetical protein ACFQ9X_55735 [Catenulispora yoronensis]